MSEHKVNIQLSTSDDIASWLEQQALSMNLGFIDTVNKILADAMTTSNTSANERN